RLDCFAGDSCFWLIGHSPFQMWMTDDTLLGKIIHARLPKGHVATPLVSNKLVLVKNMAKSYGCDQRTCFFP
ncbi:hypothetical protein J7M07_08050, partial [bacterium]|nr:hypothetical protein [bacterium]